MERGIDAVLQRLEGGAYDAKIGFDGDFETADSFDTSIIVSLLSDRRASESEVRESHKRRGWIGNEHTPGFEYGSKLWLFDQSRLTRSIMSSIADAAREALLWLVSDDHAVAIRNTSLSMTTTGVTLEVTIERDSSHVEKRYFDLWQNTGVTEVSAPSIKIIPSVKSLEVDNPNNYLRSPAAPIGISTEWTIATWIKRMDLTGSPVLSLFGISRAPGGSHNQITMVKDLGLGSTTLKMIVRKSDDGPGKNWDVGNICVSAEWLFLVATFDGSLPAVDQLHMYIDGEVPGTIVKVDDADTIMTDSPDRSISIGALLDGTYAGLYTTRTNQAIVWNSKLSQEEVVSLYNNGNPRLVDPNRHVGNYKSSGNLLAWFRPGLNPSAMGKNYAKNGVIELTDFSGVSASDIEDDFPGI
jgi:phage gp46-like protein